MFWRSRNQRAEALNTYWNALVAGQQVDAVAGSDLLALLIQDVNDSDTSPAPAMSYVHRLEAQLLSQFPSQHESPTPSETSLTSVAPVASPPRSSTERESSALNLWRNRNPRWAITGAVCFALIIAVVVGAIVVSQYDGRRSSEPSLIPAVIDGPGQSTPGTGSTVNPLAGAAIDPEVIVSDAARYWLAGNWSFVEFLPGQANVIGLCPDCKSLTFIYVMEGQLGIEVAGPALRIAREFEATEPEDIGHQLFQLYAGDAVITDLTSTPANSQIIPVPDIETRMLMGVLSTYASSFTSEATLYTSGRLQRSIGDGILGLRMDEITIGPDSRFAFEISTCRTEIYLLTSGMLIAVAVDDTELDEALTTSWEGPSGMRIDQFPQGAYDFRNDGPEPAHLYRWTIAYPPDSDATPAACS